MSCAISCSNITLGTVSIAWEITLYECVTETPYDLTGASVQVHVRKPDGTIEITAAAIDPDPTTGKIVWTYGPYDQLGYWFADVEISAVGRTDSFEWKVVDVIS